MAPLISMASGQPARTREFEVASVKASAQLAGPDYNNRFTISRSGITIRNATLRRLIAEAYGLQVRQVSGPGWLDHNEYDIEARTGKPVERQELNLMLRALLATRFQLKQHGEEREMRVYDLVVDKATFISVEICASSRICWRFSFQFQYRTTRHNLRAPGGRWFRCWTKRASPEPTISAPI
jgi:hypothetical protein